MSNQEQADVLISVLEMLREQAQYLHRQHGWMLALADAVRDNPEAKKALEQHPFYDQGPRPDMKITERELRRIDELIQRLKAGN